MNADDETIDAGECMTETDLPAALADDLDAAFPALVERFQTRIYRFTLRLTNRSQDAK